MRRSNEGATVTLYETVESCLLPGSISGTVTVENGQTTDAARYRSIS